MKIPPLHSWNLSPSEAIALQKQLAGSIDARTPLTSYELIAGADVSYNRFSPKFYAAVVVWRPADNAIIEVQEALGENRFPYIPGLLSFRELPILLEAFAKLKTRPDAVMMDGQGYAHPRRLGIASHLGLWLKRPTVGCAKTRLVGTARAPGKKAGALSPLRDKDEVIGHLVRTKFNVKPLFVSIGNMIDLPSATRLVLACVRGHRLPEPTRQAHLHSNALRRRGAG